MPALFVQIDVIWVTKAGKFGQTEIGRPHIGHGALAVVLHAQKRYAKHTRQKQCCQSQLGPAASHHCT